MKNFSRLQLIVHLGSLFPLLILAWDYFTDNLTADPIQALTQRTGRTAILLLVLSLACTPIHTLTGFSGVNKVRRALGLYSFLYAGLHFLVFAWLDYGLDWRIILEENLEKQYLWFGAITLLILLALALTSWRWWMKQLGKNWKRLHRLVYAAGLLVVLHYGLAKKGDFLGLSGDILQPLIYGGLVVILLVVRIPAVRNWITQRRARSRSWKAINDIVLTQLNKPVWNGVQRGRTADTGG